MGIIKDESELGEVKELVQEIHSQILVEPETKPSLFDAEMCSPHSPAFHCRQDQRIRIQAETTWCSLLGGVRVLSYFTSLASALRAENPNSLEAEVLPGKDFCSPL